MKNIVEHFSTGASNLNFAMGNVKEDMKKIINKYNKEGYKVVSTEIVKDNDKGHYSVNVFIVFEKIE